MIVLLDHRNRETAAAIYALQQISYRIEADLLDYPDFPPLRVGIEEIRRENDEFLGWRDDTGLGGVTSFERTPEGIHIGRMIVHPRLFRHGVAGALLAAAELYAAEGESITVSTAEKNVPAVRLYLKHQFAIVARRSLENGVVLVRMAKRRSGAAADAEGEAQRSDTMRAERTTPDE